MTKRWRVYFNKFSEAPLCWSVDSGEGTEEYKFEFVEIVGCDVVSRTEPAHRGSETKPCAWFEVEGAARSVGNSLVIER